MKRDIKCPRCGKLLARTEFGAELRYTLDGYVLLWCKSCRAEIPFRVIKPNTAPPIRADEPTA